MVRESESWKVVTAGDGSHRLMSYPDPEPFDPIGDYCRRERAKGLQEQHHNEAVRESIERLRKSQEDVIWVRRDTRDLNEEPEGNAYNDTIRLIGEGYKKIEVGGNYSLGEVKKISRLCREHGVEVEFE
jgi:hypothetical protein